jgi:thiamine-phosphate pyrophosphorylase
MAAMVEGPTAAITALDQRSLRDRLARARLLLVFTPELCGDRDPLAVLEALLEEVDVVQIRPKATTSAALHDIAADAPCPASECHRWCLLALELCRRSRRAPLVLVNDRVDVALALRDRGLAGVHLGERDFPVSEARRLLGPEPLIGLSTHSLEQVAGSAALPVDYLGFGPVFPTTTKGYARGLGAEMAWVAAGSAGRPLFPIGGITLARAAELEQVGRAAVASALLAAPEPARAARELRSLLAGAAAEAPECPDSGPASATQG